MTEKDIEIYNIENLFKYSDKSVTYKVKRNKRLDLMLKEYINNQTNLHFLIFNGLYKRITKSADDAFELEVFTENLNFNFVEYCGYKLKIIN